ncbi:MAG: type III-A CRISPR-associated RAMP protein Csm4 [Bryobacteraceae bacterium]
MNPGLLVKFRPAAPWRMGPESGARDRVDLIYHSDSLFSAVTAAMRSLGSQDEWLAATAADAQGSAVRFSSFFPFVGDSPLVAPPRSVWPPPPSAKVRWKSARFVPLHVVGSLLAGQALEEDRWNVDGPSECLIPAGRGGPFRISVRSNAAVDRLSGHLHTHASACLEFASGAGLWAAVSFDSEEDYSRWSNPVRAALRLLADSGFGGERSRGWGRSEAPEFTDGTFPDLIIPEIPSAHGTEYWLLSLFSPGVEDAVDWERGSYSVLTRGGRIESPAGSGAKKKLLNMIEEGSVVSAAAPVHGAAPNVAPDGFPHPVYRAGFAVAIPIPAQVAA